MADEVGGANAVEVAIRISHNAAKVGIDNAVEVLAGDEVLDTSDTEGHGEAEVKLYISRIVEIM